MFNKSQVSWNKNTYWRDLSKELVSHTLTVDDPTVLFHWESMFNFLNTQYPVEKYLHYEFNNVDYNPQNGNRSYTKIESPN